MVRIAVLVAVLATLAFAGGASADTPQGHLSGDYAVVEIFGTLPVSMSYMHISPFRAASDGEKVYVAKKNDKSGDCDGDTGQIAIYYGFDENPVTYNIACAHYTGNGRMAFDYFDSMAGVYVVVYVVDGSPDKLYLGTTTGNTAADATLAMKWVNLGWQGSGAKTLGLSFDRETGTQGGNFTIAA
jgi:hypothetical protein